MTRRGAGPIHLSQHERQSHPLFYTSEMKHFPALLTTRLLSPLAALHASDASNPNSIVILANDMSYPDAGFDDCKDILTPDLD